MSTVSFWTPVKVEGCSVLNWTEELLAFGREEVYHIPSESGLISNSEIEVQVRERGNSVIGVVIKVLLFATILIPLIAIIFRSIDRACNKYSLSVNIDEVIRSLKESVLYDTPRTLPPSVTTKRVNEALKSVNIEEVIRSLNESELYQTPLSPVDTKRVEKALQKKGILIPFKEGDPKREEFLRLCATEGFARVLGINDQITNTENFTITR